MNGILGDMKTSFITSSDGEREDVHEKEETVVGHLHTHPVLGPEFMTHVLTASSRNCEENNGRGNVESKPRSHCKDKIPENKLCD